MFEKSGQKLASLALLSVLFIGVVNTTAAYTIMGNVNSYEKDGYNITFSCEKGRVRLSFLTETIVRVHMAPAGKDFPKDTLHLAENGPYAVVTYDWAGVPYKISEGFDPDLEGVVYNIRAGKVTVKVRKQPFKLAFYDAKGNLLVMEKEGIVYAISPFGFGWPVGRRLAREMANSRLKFIYSVGLNFYLQRFVGGGKIAAFDNRRRLTDSAGGGCGLV